MDFDKRKLASIIATAGAGIVFGYFGWKFLSCLRVVKAGIGKSEKSPKEDNISPRIFIGNDEKRKYLLKEIHLGKKCFSLKKYEEAVNHFVNAMLVCERKKKLEKLLMKLLPKPIFEMFQTTLKEKSNTGVVNKMFEKEKTKQM